jgi:trk system potassium uptake protein TrkA
LPMKVVILGAGRVGLQLARQLISEHKEIVIIEKDAKRSQEVSRQLDCMTINDNGNSLEGLQKAGIDKADFFVGVTESDEINMISCALVSSSHNKPVTIARVRNLDYSRTWDKRPGFLGIDHIINPEIEVAKAIARTVEYGAVSSVVDFEGSDLQMRSIQVEKGSIFEGKNLSELRAELKIPFIITVISRNDKMIIPKGISQIREDDHIWILADSKHFETLLANLEKPQVYLKNIVIAGGGNIGMYVAQYLQEEWVERTGLFQRFYQRIVGSKKRNVHIIESNYQRCKELAERLPAIQITNADISEEQVLEEGRFNSYDLLITATGNQELNIVTAAHARKAGVPRSLALVKKGSTAAIARNLGVDVAISINETLVNSIQKVIRKSYARSIYNFGDSNLEMLEINVSKRPEMIGKTIQEVKLPRNSLVIMVTRQEDHIIPQGNLTIEAEDFLMLITTKENIQELE